MEQRESCEPEAFLEHGVVMCRVRMHCPRVQSSEGPRMFAAMACIKSVSGTGSADAHLCDASRPEDPARLTEAFQIGLDVRWQAVRPWVAVTRHSWDPVGLGVPRFHRMVTQICYVCLIPRWHSPTCWRCAG